MVFVNVVNVRQGVTLGVAVCHVDKICHSEQNLSAFGFVLFLCVVFCSVLNIIRKIEPSDEYFC